MISVIIARLNKAFMCCIMKRSFNFFTRIIDEGQHIKPKGDFGNVK